MSRRKQEPAYTLDGAEIVGRLRAPPRKIRDADMRPLVVEFAQARPDSQTLMHEVGIRESLTYHGKYTGTRVDLLQVASRKLVGYELKGETDSLTGRWVRQSAHFQRVFHELWLVLTENLLHRVKPSDYSSGPNVASPRWGLLVVTEDAGDLVLHKVRDPEPSDREWWPRVRSDALLQVLWRADLDKLLRAHGGKARSSYPTRLDALMEAQRLVPPEAIEAAAVDRFLCGAWREADTP